VKLVIDSAVAGFRPGALVESDRGLVFTGRKLVPEAGRCRLRGIWDQQLVLRSLLPRCCTSWRIWLGDVKLFFSKAMNVN
jgi:hypothetical protein